MFKFQGRMLRYGPIRESCLLFRPLHMGRSEAPLTRDSREGIPGWANRKQPGFVRLRSLYGRRQTAGSRLRGSAALNISTMSRALTCQRNSIQTTLLGTSHTTQIIETPPPILGGHIEDSTSRQQNFIHTWVINASNNLFAVCA